MRIKVKVKPKSKKEEVKKISEEEYEVKVKEPPEGGRANQRLIELLSEHFGVSKSRIRIVSGHTSRNKVVEIG
ncbi:DUF167 domain-containing protein [Aquifex aeolicus]|uniref:DUF167 domain-containing protein n=1 Tax=Aquifex aeolicus TaxID=63363 RepID=UPI0002EFCAA8|nr:DUF167 domain-containing protein [Aquifex aeolicus]